MQSATFAPGQVPDRRSATVAFFLGSDMTSHIIANRLIPILIGSNIRTILFTTHGKSSDKRPATLRQLFFVEHTLLQEHAYPYVNEHGVPGFGGFNTPEGWQQLAPELVTVVPVTKVNDPEFVESLPELGIDVAFSVRCYQKFQQPILDLLGGPDSESLFVNLHPGLLPWYRGVNTFLRAMQQGEQVAGFTLHHLAADWDTGDVIGQAKFPLSYSRSVLENMTTHAADAAGLIFDLVDRVASGRRVPARTQDHGAATYYSYPDEFELTDMCNRGIEVFRASAVVDLLTETFFGTVPDPAQFRALLADAVDSAGIPDDRPQVAPALMR